MAYCVTRVSFKPELRNALQSTIEREPGRRTIEVIFGRATNIPFRTGADPLHEQNYWLTTVNVPTPEAQALPEQVDVAIIGAGFTGLSAARTLAKRGAKVAVLEAETIGWGASSRNGGMVLTGMKLGVQKLISMYGRELTRRMYATSLATIDCVEQIVREEGIDCDFSRCGHLEVACKQKHFDGYTRQAEVIEVEFNHKLRVVQRHELSAEID